MMNLAYEGNFAYNKADKKEVKSLKEMIIQKNDADQRVDKFLMKALPKLPKGMMYKAIRNKKIKVNRKRCDIAQILVEGDRIQLFLPPDVLKLEYDHGFLNASLQIDVLYEDEHLLIVNKPAGLLAHSDQKQPQDTLIDRMKHYLYQKKAYDPSREQSFAPALCHRIDRNTQGIVIAAKDARTLRMVNLWIKERKIEKRYVCIVEGVPKQKEAALKLYHKKAEHNKAQISACERDGYSQILMDYHMLEKGKECALVEINLKTGRSHQIRAVMAYLGYPLLGDVKYGAKKHPAFHQALCAYQVIFHIEDEEYKYVKDKKITLSDIELVTYFHKNCK